MIASMGYERVLGLSVGGAMICARCVGLEVLLMDAGVSIGSWGCGGGGRGQIFVW